MKDTKAVDDHRLVLNNCHTAGAIIREVELQCEQGDMSYMHQFSVRIPGFTREDLSQGEDGEWYISFSAALAAGASALVSCSNLASECEDAAIKGESMASRLP
jgi:hypothetical protein